AAAQALLRPLQQLRNVSNPCVSSVICSDEHTFVTAAPVVKVLFPHSKDLKTEAGLEFESYLKCWKSKISSHDPAPESSVVSTACQQFEKVLFAIRSKQASCFLKTPDTFHSLVYAAEVAHGAEDLPTLKEVWAQVV